MAVMSRTDQLVCFLGGSHKDFLEPYHHVVFTLCQHALHLCHAHGGRFLQEEMQPMRQGFAYPIGMLLRRNRNDHRVQIFFFVHLLGVQITQTAVLLCGVRSSRSGVRLHIATI